MTCECESSCPTDVVLERFFFYETSGRFIFSGCNITGSIWRILIIHTTSLPPADLTVEEDTRSYTRKECKERIREILAEFGSTDASPVEFYGIAGFIQLLDSFYTVLITRRRTVGNIAGHDIHAVEAVRYLAVPYQSSSVQTTGRSETKNLEERYVKMLADNEPTRDCYFSYSYDLRRSLQTNMGGPPYTEGDSSAQASDMFTWNRK